VLRLWAQLLQAVASCVAVSVNFCFASSAPSNASDPCTAPMYCWVSCGSELGLDVMATVMLALISVNFASAVMRFAVRDGVVAGAHAAPSAIAVAIITTTMPARK